jgi:beta-N-acetylhexosaminidase
MLPRLSLEEQVGQVIVASWLADQERLAWLVARGWVGGMLIPPDAGPAAGELAATLNGLQWLASHPLLCAADLANPALWDPGALALGAAHQPDLARRAGAEAGARARAVGVHLLLGPTLDVHRGPGRGKAAWRSFGENPSLVASLGAAFVAGCRAAGALAVGRDFPGGGGTLYDAGRGLAALPYDRQTLEKIDLLPYVQACRAGLGAIISGHVHVSALDNLPSRLATHSSAVVQGLLRTTLQFDGLLLTSSLDTPEVATRYAPGQAAVLAIAAGHDLLITASPEEVYRTLYEVFLHGDVPRARLEEAVRRVWAAREWLGLLGERYVATAAAVGRPEPTLAQELAQAALVAIRGRPELLAGRPLLVLANRSLRPDGTPLEDDLRHLAAGRLRLVAFHTLDPRPAPSQLDGALAAAGGAEGALLFADLPGDQPDSPAAGTLAAMAQALKRLGLVVGVVAVGDPYALARFPAADLLLYLAGDSRPYLEAAFAYLLGQVEALGRLPVTVPGLD